MVRGENNFPVSTRPTVVDCSAWGHFVYLPCSGRANNLGLGLFDLGAQRLQTSRLFSPLRMRSGAMIASACGNELALILSAEQRS